MEQEEQRQTNERWKRSAKISVTHSFYHEERVEPLSLYFSITIPDVLRGDINYIKVSKDGERS